MSVISFYYQKAFAEPYLEGGTEVYGTHGAVQWYLGHSAENGVALISPETGCLAAMLDPNARKAFYDARAHHGRAARRMHLLSDYDSQALAARLTEIHQAQHQRKLALRRAGRAMGLARMKYREGIEMLNIDNKKIDKMASELLARIDAPVMVPTPVIQPLALSAVTPHGCRVLWDTAARLCPRLFLLRGIASGHVLFKMAARLWTQGIPALSCPHPLCPERPQAVLLPQIGVGFADALETPPQNLRERIPWQTWIDCEPLSGPLPGAFEQADRQIKRMAQHLQAAAKASRQAIDKVEEAVL